MSGQRLEIAREGDVVIARLAGEIDLANTPAVSAAVLEAVLGPQREDGASGRDFSQLTSRSVPAMPSLVSMKVWPERGTMSTVTDGEERNSSACILAYCTSKSRSFAPNWRKTGTLMLPT